MPLLRSCKHCHQRKAKCTGGHPCDYCKKNGLECVFEEQKKRGPRRGALQRLREEVCAKKYNQMTNLEQPIDQNLQCDQVRMELSAAEARIAQLEAEKRRNSGKGRPKKPTRAEIELPYPVPGTARTSVLHPGALVVQELERGSTSAAAAPPLLESRQESLMASAAQAHGLRTRAAAAMQLSKGLAEPWEEARFIYIFFVYCNPAIPMVCKEWFHRAGIALGKYAEVDHLCVGEIPCCDHRDAPDSQGCSTLTFVRPCGSHSRWWRTRSKRRRTSRSSRGDTRESEAMTRAASLLGVSVEALEGATDGAGRVFASKIPVPDVGSAGRKRMRSGVVRRGEDDEEEEEAEEEEKERGWFSEDLGERAKAQGIARLAAFIQGRSEKSPLLPSEPLACAALFNATLAVGARMVGQVSLGDRYVARARAALAAVMDEPSQETVSALSLVGYYLAGTAADGDVSRARCHFTLANEMADLVIARVRGTAPPTAAETAATDTGAGGMNEMSSEGAESAPASASGESDLAPPEQLETMPMDVILGARFFGQLTAVSRDNPFVRPGPPPTASDPSPEWRSPRARLVRQLSYVVTRIRRRISSPADLESSAERLLAVLDSAEQLTVDQRIGGRLAFANLATIHTSRAVILHACGRPAEALASADRAIGIMEDDLWIFASYMTLSVFVQVLPVLVRAGPAAAPRVHRILHMLGVLAAIWPVGRLLVAKARRRIGVAPERRGRGSLDTLSAAAAGLVRGAPPAEVAAALSSASQRADEIAVASGLRFGPPTTSASSSSALPALSSRRDLPNPLPSLPAGSSSDSRMHSNLSRDGASPSSLLPTTTAPTTNTTNNHPLTSSVLSPFLTAAGVPISPRTPFQDATSTSSLYHIPSTVPLPTSSSNTNNLQRPMLDLGSPAIDPSGLPMWPSKSSLAQDANDDLSLPELAPTPTSFEYAPETDVATAVAGAAAAAAQQADPSRPSPLSDHRRVFLNPFSIDFDELYDSIMAPEYSPDADN